MPNIKITIEYDGTRYHGWQWQENAMTIQQKLEEGISKILKENIKICGAGRTDAGVHAKAQVANFKVEECIVPLNRLPLAINPALPEDIIIHQAERVDDDFHSRTKAKGKIYSYSILNRRYPSPIRRNYSHHISQPLSFDKMVEGGKYFEGTHDFSAFKSSKSMVKSSERTIYKVSLEQRDDDLITFTYWGNEFLYNMIRILTGTLVEVGLGNIKPKRVKEIILSKDRRLAGQTLPPNGLVLEKVIY